MEWISYIHAFVSTQFLHYSNFYHSFYCSRNIKWKSRSVSKYVSWRIVPCCIDNNQTCCTTCASNKTNLKRWWCKNSAKSDVWSLYAIHSCLCKPPIYVVLVNMLFLNDKSDLYDLPLVYNRNLLCGDATTHWPCLFRHAVLPRRPYIGHLWLITPQPRNWSQLALPNITPKPTMCVFKWLHIFEMCQDLAGVYNFVSDFFCCHHTPRRSSW